MKLHLTKSLRAALLACVCGGLAFTQAWAADPETVTPDTYNGYYLSANKSYILGNADGDERVWVESDAQGVGATIVVDQGVTTTVNQISQSDKTLANEWSYIKDGEGILVVSQDSYLEGERKRLSSVTVKNGTLKINYGSGNPGNGFATGDVTVNGGATLQLAAVDALGYKNGQWGGNYTDNINLGDDSGETAKLQIDAITALTSDINLNGNAAITGSGDLRALGGSITASGSNNSISTTLLTRADMNVVVEKNGFLTISGTISDAEHATSSNTDLTSKDFIKSGEGTLTLASTATVADTINFIVDEGSVKHEGTVDRSYTLRGGTIILDNNRIGNEDSPTGQTTTGVITLAKETNDTTSENTIKSEGSPGAIFTDVTGEGNLTLKGGVNVYGDMDFKGNLTLESGTYNLGYNDANGGYGVSPTIANDGTVTIKSGATATLNSRSNDDKALLQNSGDITVNGKLTVNKGTVANGTYNDEGELTQAGTIYVKGENALMEVNSDATINSAISVSDGGKVDVGNTPTFASSITVGDGGTLDVADTLTLNTDALTLESGSTLVLGANKPLTMDGGVLTVQSGAIIDLSAWGLSATTFGDETLFTGVDTLTFTDAEGKVLVGEEYGYIQIKFSEDGGLWDYWLYDAGTGNVNAVPEPATATLSLLALAGLAARRRRK